jgi:hypothetical protein
MECTGDPPISVLLGDAENGIHDLVGTHGNPSGLGLVKNYNSGW